MIVKGVFDELIMLDPTLPAKTGFANDLTTFRGKDDVLTLMIHLGYLAYDSEKKTVRIPNEEIRREFQRSVHEVKHEATLKLNRPILLVGIAYERNAGTRKKTHTCRIIEYLPHADDSKSPE